VPAASSIPKWRRLATLNLLGLGLVWLFAIGIAHAIASALQLIALRDFNDLQFQYWPYLLMLGSISASVFLLVKLLHAAVHFVRRRSLFSPTFATGILTTMFLTIYDMVGSNLIAVILLQEELRRPNLTIIGVLIGFMMYLLRSQSVRETFNA
jgi:hypothetical protein